MAKAAKDAAPAPHTEAFTIQRRPYWSFLGALTVTIECDPLSSQFVKLGLAVRAAFASGASLVGASLVGASLVGARLDGASLVGARLDGASLDGASLDGARLDGARLDGALIRDDKVARLLAAIGRQNDAYVFYASELQGGGVKILAGCRWFTVAEYRAHVFAEYADEDKGRETSDILDFIEARCRALDVALEPAVTSAAA